MRLGSLPFAYRRTCQPGEVRLGKWHPYDTVATWGALLRDKVVAAFDEISACELAVALRLPSSVRLLGLTRFRNHCRMLDVEQSSMRFWAATNGFENALYEDM